MPAHERSAVMARGYPGFADGRSRAEFEGVKKNSKKSKHVAIWSKNSQIQRSDFTHPDRMVGVIQQVIAGVGVQKDHQPVSADSQPGQYNAEQFGAEGQLAAPVGVRTDRAFVDS